MLNYMRAEFFKAFRRKYLYITLLTLMGGVGLLTWGWWFANQHGNFVTFDTGGGVAVVMLSMGLYLSVLICDLVFSDQYKHNTLKNEVSYGLPRATIYLGKLAVQVLVGLAMSLSLLVVYEVLCFAVLPSGDGGAAAATLKMVAYCTAVAIPQWLGILSVANMMFFLLRSDMLASLLVVGTVFVPHSILKLMGILVDPIFSRAAAWMPNAIVEAAQSHLFEGDLLAQSWLVGLVWVAVSTAVGLTAFRRKEIS